MTEKDMLVELTEVDTRSKSNQHRLDEVEKKLSDNEKMLTSIALIAQRQDKMDGDIQEMKSDIKTITAKPSKRWDSIVDKIILSIVAAIIAFVLARIGLGG